MAGTKPLRNLKKQRNSEIFSSLPNVSIQDKLPPQRILLQPAVKYNIDDEAWLDKVDQATGSLLYVDAVPRPESRLTSSGVFESTSSGSSSSISSLVSPETSPSRQSLYQQSDSLAQISHSPSMSEYRHSPQKSEYRNSPSMSALDEKASKGGSREGKSPKRSPSYRKSAALDPRQLDSISLSSSLPRSFPPVPQGEQFGSRGVPLDENALCITRVKIDLVQYHIGVEGGNPCSLELLGIVPTRGPIPRQGHAIFASSRLSLRSHRRHLPGHSPVVIRDVAKFSPAAVTQQLHQGDTVIAVNGTPVDMSNVDSVLSVVTDEVQLMIRKNFPIPNPGSPSLSKLVAGSKVTLRSLSRFLQSLPHLLLYLTFDTREDDLPDMDILYRYPLEGAERLLQTRGLFLTLSDIVGSIGHDSLSSSSLVLDGHLVHLGYVQNGKELVLLALPANIASLYHIKLLVREVQKMLELMFGSLASAFKRRDHHPFLDHLFSMFFQKHLAPLPYHCTSPLRGVASAPLLSIPMDLKLKLSAALTELDSIDRSSQPEVMCAPSAYRLVGSCFFYQGTLVCSHLCDSDLQCAVLFCNAHRLLELTAAESVNQVVIWRKVWLPSDTSPTEDHVYLLHRRSTYMLVVGVERVIVCMLLEGWRSDVEGVATVDTMRIESAHTLVAEMRAKGLLDGIDRRVCTPTPFPSVVLADVAMAAMFSSRHRTVSTNLGDIQGSNSEDESSSPPVNKIASENRFKFQKKDLSLPVLSLVGGYSKGVPRPADMLNAGVETIVLHYIDLHAEKGVMLCPIHTAPIGAVHREVLECFVEVCGCIRQTMWRRRCGRGAVEEEDYSENDDEEEDGEEEHPRNPPVCTVIPSTPPPPPSPPNPLVIEHGVLLSCAMDQSSDKHRAPSFNYWVVGRLFPDTGRELYVCFVDNTSQNIIEMAFRLAFGTTC